MTTRFKVYKDAVNEWRWTFFGANGEALAVSSEGYKARADCLHCIDLIRAAPVEGEAVVPPPAPTGDAGHSPEHLEGSVTEAGDPSPAEVVPPELVAQRHAKRRAPAKAKRR